MFGVESDSTLVVLPMSNSTSNWKIAMSRQNHNLDNHRYLGKHYLDDRRCLGILDCLGDRHYLGDHDHLGDHHWKSWNWVLELDSETENWVLKLKIGY